MDGLEGRGLTGRELASISSYINVRQYPRGPGLTKQAQVEPVNTFLSEQRILLYIHGFNNSRRQASASYATFDRNIEDVEKTGVCVFWPGDRMARALEETSDPPALQFAFSAIFYNAQIENARFSAELIFKELDRILELRGERGLKPLEVHIVAHSLGCLVALHLLQMFPGESSKKRIRFSIVALMAAAVPQELVKKGGTLRLALERPEQVLVYWSDGDGALGFVFGMGQILNVQLKHLLFRGNRGALGSNGLEESSKLHMRYGRRGHSEYWTDATIAAEVGAAITTGLVERRLEREQGRLERILGLRRR